MDGHTLYILFGLLLSSPLTLTSIWRCTQNADCDSLSGSVCDVTAGACVCAPGQQPVLGGRACVDVAPYLTSPCMEDHQCSRLFTSFECRRINTTTLEGNCFCAEGHHYFRGRCWRSIDFGVACTRDEECLGAIQNPFSMSCRGSCQCSAGYYERQRGDCRKIALEVGDGCVLDIDCQFPEGVCDLPTLRCIYNGTTPEPPVEEPSTPEPPVEEPSTPEPELDPVEPKTRMALQLESVVRRVTCNGTTPCEKPFECSPFGVCICPVGYYESANGQQCLAELGSPADADQCVGFLAVVIDGVCTCPPNFFFEENMRDCVRATRRFTDSCIADSNCHTFGPASRCGPPKDPWGFRTCDCILEHAVWDPRLTFCRFFSGVGGTCEVDSDCQAGQLEIHCVKNEAGQGICSCPDGLEEFEGLCLDTGLGLGDSCQHTRECTATANTMCDPHSNLCACSEGYQANDGVCSPIIGGTCTLDSDCVIENTECRNSTDGLTCECKETFLAYQDACWPEVSGYNSTCSVSAQCVATIGEASVCENNLCICSGSHHFRDGNCWPVTRLLEPCTTISQCYLSSTPERVVCRNGLCQCDFRFPHSEDLQTCLPTSSATSMRTSLYLLLIATLALLKR